MLKPIFGKKGDPPFYDPNDLHCHVWQYGQLLYNENPKSPYYSKNLVMRDCEHCIFCHTIKNNFESKVYLNLDTYDEIKHKNIVEVYKPLHVQHDEYDNQIIRKEKNEQKINNYEINHKLYHNNNENLKEYDTFIV